VAVMPTDNQRVDSALELARLAAVCQDEYVRLRLLIMAREWMAAAMHETKPPEPKTLLPA